MNGGKRGGSASFDPTQSIELSMHPFELEFTLSW